MHLPLPILALAPFALLIPFAHANISQLNFTVPDGALNSLGTPASYTSGTARTIPPIADDGVFYADAQDDCCVTGQGDQPDIVSRNDLFWERSTVGLTSPKASALAMPFQPLPNPNPVNQIGTFSGYADVSTSFHPESSLTLATLAAVPEPSTLALLGSGILAAAGLLHRRRA